MAEGGRSTEPDFEWADAAWKRRGGSAIRKVACSNVKFVPAIFGDVRGDAHSARLAEVRTVSALDLAVVSGGVRGGPIEVDTELGTDILDLLGDALAVVRDDASNGAPLGAASNNEGPQGRGAVALRAQGEGPAIRGKVIDYVKGTNGAAGRPGTLVPGRVYEEGASSFHAPNPLPDLRHWLACLLAQDAMVTLGREEGEINGRTGSADLGSDGVRGAVVGMAETTVPGLESGDARDDESGVDSGGNARERVKTLADAGTVEKGGTAAVAESDTGRVETDEIAVRAVAESANGDEAHRGGGDVQSVIEDKVLAAAERQTNLPDASGEDNASIDAADTARGDGSQLEEVVAHRSTLR